MWPFWVSHGAASVKQTSLFKLTEQLLLRTEARLLSEDCSLVLVLFPRLLRLPSTHAGLVSAAQLGSLRSAKGRSFY